MEILQTTTISRFELDVASRDGGKRKYSLHHESGGMKAKVVHRDPGGGRRVERHKRAAEEVERLLSAMRVSKDMSEEQLLDRACAALLLRREDIDEIEVELEFTSSTELQVGLTRNRTETLEDGRGAPEAHGTVAMADPGHHRRN